MTLFSTTRRPYVTIILCIISISLFAQRPVTRNPTLVPVFRSKNDSIRFSTVEKALSDALNKWSRSNGPRIDSLMTVQRTIVAEGIVRYRRVYRSSDNFITSDSLQKMQNFTGVTRVSVANRDHIPLQVLNCTDLEILELVNTSIQELPEQLNILTRLKTINIYNNIPRKKFRFGKNEHVINLTIRNENPALLPASFENLSNLQKLDLADNMIKKFPNGSRRNKKLVDLMLQRNAIMLKKGRVRAHPYVQQLALQGNKIQRVPSAIRKFRNLKKLSFNNNEIRKVHRNIQKLKHLEHLSFYNNKLAAIPAGVYKLSSLTEIDLFYNQIEKLEPGFTNWKKLNTLFLSNNRLLALPENIHELTALTGLYVWDNRLSNLPENIGLVSGLKYLRANHNYLKVLPPSILNLIRLEEIDISNNFIEALPEEFFNYNNLRIMAMSKNPWNAKMKGFLKRKVQELRAKEVFVHVSEDAVEKP